MVRISGKNGEGTDQLLEQIEKILQKQKLYLEKLYGYQEAGKIQLIRSHGQLLKEEYRDDGIYVEAYIPKEIVGCHEKNKSESKRQNIHTESNQQ